MTPRKKKKKEEEGDNTLLVLGYLLRHASTRPNLFVFSVIFNVVQRFFCGGRLIFGPDVASLFLSVLLVGGPAIGFCIKIYIVIQQHIKDGKDVGLWYPVLVVACVLTVLVSNSTFILASCSLCGLF